MEISDIKTVGDVLGFLLWVPVTMGVCWVIFYSLPSEFLRLRLRTSPEKEKQISILRFEIGRRVVFDPNKSPDDDMTTNRPLTIEELEERRARLQELSVEPLWKKLLRYLMTCTLCQLFWAGVLVYLCCGAPGGFFDGLWFAFAMAILGVEVWSRSSNRPSSEQPQQRSGGCGARR